ncbi:hypothetical protein RUND412_008931, partial [Rhizina undulata]
LNGRAPAMIGYFNATSKKRQENRHQLNLKIVNSEVQESNLVPVHEAPKTWRVIDTERKAPVSTFTRELT